MSDNVKKIQVFRASDGVPVDDKKMPMLGMDESVLTGFGKLMAAAGEPTGDSSGGEEVKCLFEQPGNGLSLCYAWFKSGYVLPRHSHDADCVYYVIAGDLKLGNQVIGKGDGFFVPCDAPYSYEVGPNGVEILEFRNVSEFHFMFRNNSDAHWDKMATSISSNKERWQEESVRPSDRVISS